MLLPKFSPHDDPGPSFTELYGRLAGQTPRIDGDPANLGELTHATTIVSVRYSGGVVLAGDRRATAGNVIAHRTMDKIHAADQHSGVGIAGAAGMAMEMVRLFQTELEHYEKVEGTALSLEGKANKLAQMIRAHLPAAMQGMAVVPIFCGFDTLRSEGRIYSYDVTGGRYEEADFATTGSGGRDARTVVKLRWTDGMSADDATELATEALYEAADEDSATGGPDLIRRIYPQVAVIDAAGFQMLDPDVVGERFAAVIERRTGAIGGGDAP